MTAPKIRLAVLVAVAGGLILLTGTRAEDKPKDTKTPVSPPKAAEPIKPKPLSDTVKKGLEYLAKQQHANGGWGQGGGWRTVETGGRIEGAEVKDPPDVGNTCIALLALIRAGNTPTEGQYAKEVAKAVEFICGHVSKSDDKTLLVTDVKGTQLQSKIGPFVDTFLTAVVLAELKGKMSDDKGEKMLVTALTKTVNKIEKNQQADGTFKGNEGWASVLSQGLACKGLARAAQSGVAVRSEALDRFKEQVAMNFDRAAGDFKAGAGAGTAASAGRVPAGGLGRASGPAKGAPAGAPSDAGVPLYSQGQGLTNFADVAGAMRKARDEAMKTLEKKDSTKEEKAKAQDTIKKADEVDKLREDATRAVVNRFNDPNFAKGFGSNGGEEFLSFMNIGEALLMKGGEEFTKWDKVMTESLVRVQDGDGSWSGHHCITGKTFCTASALLVLMTDRAPVTAAEVKK